MGSALPLSFRYIKWDISYLTFFKTQIDSDHPIIGTKDNS